MIDKLKDDLNKLGMEELMKIYKISLDLNGIEAKDVNSKEDVVDAVFKNLSTGEAGLILQGVFKMVANG